jgi:hypothetical protein
VIEEIMPKNKPREANRKDIWLTDQDKQNIGRITAAMKKRGIAPARAGKYTLSQVVRFALEEFVKSL